MKQVKLMLSYLMQYIQNIIIVLYNINVFNKIFNIIFCTKSSKFGMDFTFTAHINSD